MTGAKPGEPILVADIGATNGRFAIATGGGAADGDSAALAVLSDIQVFRNEDFEDFPALFARYISGLQGGKPAQACIAVAGPNDGRRGIMVNRGWTIDAAAVEARAGLAQVRLVNDFSALAAAVPLLGEDDACVLQPGVETSGPITVIGPGTGLGVAHLVPINGQFEIISTEGGHAAFAPVTHLERELQSFLAPNGGYLEVEELLSGRGLENIHRFISARAAGFRHSPASGNPEPPSGSAPTLAAHHRHSRAPLSKSGNPEKTWAPEASPSPASTLATLLAPQITKGALSGEDPLSRQAVDLFLGILGSAMGDFALSVGAKGGVYLGGGIPPRLLPLIPASTLIPRFNARGPLSPYAQAIPIRLITADFLALRGAARLFHLAAA